MNYNIKDDRMYTVYMHVNKINNKKYIGITCQAPEVRWGKNGCGYHCSSYFYNAIKKYGWDNFDHLILYTDLDGNSAKQKEIELIREHNTINSVFGYNLTFGGQSNIPNSETRAKMSIAQKKLWETEEYRGRMSKIRKEIASTVEFKTKTSINSRKNWNDPETRERRIRSLRLNGKKKEFKEKMRNITIGKNNGFYGKKHNEESKQKMREKKIGRKQSEEHKNNVAKALSKPVVMLNKDDNTLVKKFSNAKEANVFLGVKNSHISGCCRGERKTSNGYKWMYLEEYEQMKSAN